MSELDAYDYHLPPELIAQEPTPQRPDARLLVVNRATGELDHRFVRDLPELLSPGDCLVLNETRVVPARLVGRKATTGGRFEGLFLSADESGLWRLLARTRGRLRPGERIVLTSLTGEDAWELELGAKLEGGAWVARPRVEGDAWRLLAEVGRVPLPCYIRHGLSEDRDLERYQTVFARVPGSAAAPTAGLHFTTGLLERCQARGIGVAKLVLHVGLDTFRPVQTATLAEHPMHAEWCELSADTATQLAGVRARGGRIVAVGTTSVRTLETAAQSGTPQAWRGETRLFIRPPYQFRGTDVILTNFHLPRSTLLVLVSTFAGRALIERAYAAAIAEGYRFYSYGDAMLVV